LKRAAFSERRGEGGLTWLVWTVAGVAAAAIVAVAWLLSK
jgi:hypothetical protein